MPMPYRYRHAGAEFAAYLVMAKDLMGMASDNSAYTATEGVFRAFRARAAMDEVLRLADILPAVLATILTAGWTPTAPKPWGDRAAQVAEAMALRRDHNLTPPTCIDAVAEAVAASVRTDIWDDMMASLSPDAQTFWQVPPERRHPPRFV